MMRGGEPHAEHRCSFWSLIAPDPVIRDHLWPYCSDVTAVRACCVNAATVASFSSFPISQPFTGDARNVYPTLRVLPTSNVRCVPRVTSLTAAEWSVIRPLLHSPLLSHLQKLECSGAITESVDGLLPASLLSLTLLYEQQPVSAATLPHNLTSLTLHHSWSAAVQRPVDAPAGDGLCPSVLPASLTELTLDDRLLLPGMWPICLRKLVLLMWMQPLKPRSLPASLRLLAIGNGFNFAIAPDTIPDSVEELTIASTQWDYTLEGVLHPHRSRLRCLTLGMAFSQPFTPLSLPYSVHTLHLDRCCYWDHDLHCLQLPNLRELKLGSGYSKPLEASSLSGCPALQLLSMFACTAFRHSLAADVWPVGLVTLELPKCFRKRLLAGVLPLSLRHLRLGSDTPMDATVLPAGLLSLRAGSPRFNQFLSVGLVPASLTRLHIGGAGFRQSLHAAFSAECALTELTLTTASDYTHHITAACLPPRLTRLDLKLPNWAGCLQDGALPASLLHLRFRQYNQTWSVATFASCPMLQRLSLAASNNYQQPIAAGVLPPSLTQLQLPPRYTQPLHMAVLPAALRLLSAPAACLVGPVPASLQVRDVTRWWPGYDEEVVPDDEEDEDDWRGDEGEAQ